ncbi:MAG TPA: uracil-DNA glycosylase [bacterium]
MRGRDRRVAGSRSGPRGRLEATPRGVGRDRLSAVARDVVACAACPRLRRYCAAVAARGKREFAGWRYWAKPVPGFGDPRAELLVVGLAPAAHGANRTGRMFTGDGSGAWLIRAMHRAGFANQSTSVRRGDGLRLHGAYITAVVRCAPPDNKPAPVEMARCRSYLARELALLPRVRVILALGRIGFEACRRLLAAQGADIRAMRFAHGAACAPGPAFPTLIASYHPSRQNTNTGKLTEPMLDRVFEMARDLLDERGSGRRIGDV